MSDSSVLRHVFCSLKRAYVLTNEPCQNLRLSGRINLPVRVPNDVAVKRPDLSISELMKVIGVFGYPHGLKEKFTRQGKHYYGLPVLEAAALAERDGVVTR